MNVYDSELISELLKRNRFEEVTSPNKADIILVNTCTVRLKAENKGREYAKKWKKRGKIVVLIGCLAQQDKEKLLDCADIVIGTRSYSKLIDAIRDFLKTGKSSVFTGELGLLDLTEIPSTRSIPRNKFSEFVTIMRGCDNFCSYCIVPYVRGREICRPPESILEEIHHLEKRGVKEITLLGQNVNSYIHSGIDFADLLAMIDRESSLYRVRFTTSHPRDMSYKVIRTVLNSKRLTRWFHLPLQAGSTKILKLMRRGYTKEEFIDLAMTIRKEDPEATITTDMMVGFPGEDERDFEDTLDVVRKVEFDHAYTFIFVKRPYTAAYHMEETLTPEEKGRRLRVLIETTNEVIYRRRARMLGKVYEVLVEGPSRKDRSLSKGRTDGNITVVINRSLPAGTIAKVKVISIKGLTPIAELLEIA